MKINDIEISTLNAKLLKKQVANADIATKEEWADGWIQPIMENQYHKYLNIECKFLIESEDIEEDISKLIKIASTAELEFDNSNIKYKGFVTSHLKEMILKDTYTLDITWKCSLGYESQITKSIQNNDTITLSSTADTPVIVEITPVEDIAELEILGFGESITLKNLTENVKVTIDGEKGLVTENGLNKFNDYESWGFPKLIPGDNKITISPNISIDVSFKPRWL